MTDKKRVHCRTGSLENGVNRQIGKTKRSLPYRQLRNYLIAATWEAVGSLPYRQLRKIPDTDRPGAMRSLPYRQLRKDCVRICGTERMFTAVQAA